jgi:hypothetical protein
VSVLGKMESVKLVVLCMAEHILKGYKMLNRPIFKATFSLHIILNVWMKEDAKSKFRETTKNTKLFLLIT